jgi:hypothetical protein
MLVWTYDRLRRITDGAAVIANKHDSMTKHVPFYNSSSVHSHRCSFWAVSQLKWRTSPQVTSNAARNADNMTHIGKKLFVQNTPINNHLSWTDVSWDILYVAQGTWCMDVSSAVHWKRRERKRSWSNLGYRTPPSTNTPTTSQKKKNPS